MALEDGRAGDVACVGDNCVDVALENPGEELAGGNALNVAVELARAGRRATYFGAVGDDSRAAIILEAAQAAGVATAEMRRLPGATGVTVVARTDGGERTFVSQDYGASADYRLDEATAARVATHRVAHFARQPDLADWAPFLRDAGVRVTADLGVEGGAEALAELADHLDVVFLSSSSTPERTPEELLDAALQAGAALAVVTCGAEGSMAATRRRRWRAPAEAVDRVVDTLGAGDAFIAACLSSLLDDDDVERALRAGSRAGAAACARRGLASPIEAQEVPL